MLLNNVDHDSNKGLDPKTIHKRISQNNLIMAGSALLWNSGSYLFGNADQNSRANQNGLGNDILEQEQQRQARIQSNSNTNNDNVIVDEENTLLNPKKKVSYLLPNINQKKYNILISYSGDRHMMLKISY